MKILVTGGAGFIGSHVCEALVNAGYSPIIADDFSTGKLENLPDSLHKHVTLEKGDISDYSFALKLFERHHPEAVIHLAAQAAISTSFQNPKRDLEVNTYGTLNMLELAKKYGAKRFIFSSTSAVYSEHCDIPTQEFDAEYPNTPYGISKLAAEGYVRTLFPESVILRFGNVIGPRQVPIGENQVLSRMIRHFKYGDKFFIHGSGEQKRDFVDVWDVARAVLCAVHGVPGIYNIASGEAHSVNEMARILEEKFHVTGYNWDHTKMEDPRGHVCLDISAAKKGLNWQPDFSFEQSVSQTIAWWESL